MANEMNTRVNSYLIYQIHCVFFRAYFALGSMSFLDFIETLMYLL